MNVSLNDAAILLIQLEPEDRDELIELKKLLDAIAHNESYSEKCRDIVQQAELKLDVLIDGESDEDGEVILRKVGRHLENAIHLSDKSLYDIGEKNQSETKDESKGDSPIEASMKEEAEQRETDVDEKDDQVDVPQETSEDVTADRTEKTDIGDEDDLADDEETAAVDADEDDEPTEDMEIGDVLEDEDDDQEVDVEYEEDTMDVATADESVDPIQTQPKSQSFDFCAKDGDRDLIDAFVTESSDLITNAEDALLNLENDPDDMESVDIVFRAFHTIKGTSAFLEMSFLSELAHNAENLLARVRDGEIRFTGKYPDLAFQSIDMIKEIIRSIQSALIGNPCRKPKGYDELQLILSESAPVTPSDQYVTPPTVPEQPKEAFIHPFPLDAEEVKTMIGAQEADSDIDMDPVADDESVSSTLRRMETTRQLVESSIRVPVERLDRFIDMVGELVVAHSMVAQDNGIVKSGDHELLKKISHTTKIVRELQSMSMSLRMIPLKSTFRKMARLARDLSHKVGKSVTFITEGEETEIDRNMVDFINDPLVHMVRNAVDHGIEPPDIRLRAGKPANGTIKLSAYHSAGNVIVEIRDDGRGFNRKAIVARAVERGLISDDQKKDTSQIADRDIFNLIFLPGFSTAKTVSEVSGRGVGLDVVRKNVETLHGQVEIQSDHKKGSIFRMSLPLTLAIIDGMVVRVGKEKFVIPMVSIIRSIRPKTDDISTVLHRGEMIAVSDRLIPFFRLANLFEILNAKTDPSEGIVVVVESDGKHAGLMIDELIGTQQIVIKNLGEIMRNIPGISGSAIMPNGRVGLILDVGGLVRLANSVDLEPITRQAPLQANM